MVWFLFLKVVSCWRSSITAGNGLVTIKILMWNQHFIFLTTSHFLTHLRYLFPPLNGSNGEVFLLLTSLPYICFIDLSLSDFNACRGLASPQGTHHSSPACRVLEQVLFALRGPPPISRPLNRWARDREGVSQQKISRNKWLSEAPKLGSATHLSPSLW